MSAKKQTLEVFIKETASNSPVPGGGSIAALTASSGAALVAMLANLTIGKKGYESVEEKMKEVAVLCEKKAVKFLDEIDTDAAAFQQYMDALKLPKDTDEQKAARTAVMQKAVVQSTMVPMNLAKECVKLIPYADYAIEFGNKNATSDGAVGASLLKTAADSAIYNVKINLPSIKDEALKEKLTTQYKKLERKAKRLLKKALEKVGF